MPDFAATLEQWTNSAMHRANLLLHGAKWIGVAHAQNGRRIYWAMVIGENKNSVAVCLLSGVKRTLRQTHCDVCF
jgi:hypothetical protein